MKNQIRIVPVLALASLVGLGVVLIFFLNSEPQDVKDFFAQRPTLPTLPKWEWPKKNDEPVVVAAPVPHPRPHDEPPHRPPLPSAPKAPPVWKPMRERRAVCTALTWGVVAQEGMAVTVGHTDNVSDPVRGDTPCEARRALLCFKHAEHPRPAQYTHASIAWWSGSELALIPDVQGTELTSFEAAGALCARKLGTGWRMAEFHDGGEWRFAGFGELPIDARFWVAIADQYANPWN